MRYVPPVVAAILIAVAGFVVGAASQQPRIAALEQQLTAGKPATATAAPATRARTFKATNGIVLTAADLDRLDAMDRRATRAAAELEYLVKSDDARK